MIGIVPREAWASTRAQPMVSAVTMLMVAGMIIAVMLTTGRTVGAEQQVLATIDSAGTRTIVIRAETDAGLTSSVLEHIAGIEGIEWAGGFSHAVDGTNSQIPDGVRTPVRFAYGEHLGRLGIPAGSPLPGELAWASSTALDRLGMPDASGGLALTTGASYGIAGQIDVPEFLAEFEPLVLVPQPNPTGEEPIGVLVVIASSPDAVPGLSDAVLSVIAVDDPTTITVQTSEELAALRAVVQGQLGSFSRGLVIALLGVTGALVAVLQFSLVMMRRKDFGRRRALGATRTLIVGLLLAQTGLLAAAGAAIGLTTSIVLLIAGGDPLPDPAFITALAILALATALLAAALPAVVASRRDPVRELRLP